MGKYKFSVHVNRSMRGEKWKNGAKMTIWKVMKNKSNSFRKLGKYKENN